MPIRLFAVLVLFAAAAFAEAPPRHTIVCLGDSLTAGHGLSAAEAWPALLQAKVDEAGLPFAVINAGVSGDTTAGGLRRADWLLRWPIAVLVIELGANDGLRGLPIEAMEHNLQALIDKVRARYPEARILLAGMQIPPNMGPDYARAYGEVFPRLAQSNSLALWPFVLEGVAGRPELNQEDGLHPNAAGQRILAENAWRALQPLLRTQTPAPRPPP